LVVLEVIMPDAPIMLDALSEMLALSSYGNTKNLIITALETRGPLDEAAMGLAVQKAAEKYPQMQSCLGEVRQRGACRLFRYHRPDLPLPVTVSELRDPDPSVPVLTSFLDHVSHRLDRDWDLFQEVPAELYLVKLGKDHHVVAPVLHHAAADGGVASEFGRELLAHYHRLVTGEEPRWAETGAAVSTSGKRRVNRKHAQWTDFLSESREAISHVLEKPAVPAGNGESSDLRQHHVKRVLSPEDTKRAVKVSATNGASLVDLLSMAGSLAVDGWDRVRGVPPGILTSSMSVNMKGRFGGMDAPNNSALLFFRSLPHERADCADFVRTLALRRIRQFRRQMDLKFYRDVSRMNALLRAFPFPMRRKLVHFIMQHYRYSVAITLLGVIWPVFRNGRPTTESAFTRSGNLDITEIHGIGYKLLSSTPLLFIVYFYRNRLNLVLAASAGLFTRNAAEEFMDLFLNNLLAGECRQG
jgi:hypothetical protein